MAIGLLKTRRPQSLKRLLIVRFSILFLVLFLAVQGIVTIGFRSISLDSAKSRALGSASMVLDALTTFMVMGGIAKRDIFFSKITDSRYGITKIRVLRGDAVTKQFGPPREEEKPETDLDFLVLKTGAIQERIREDENGVQYNLVVPYKAIPSKTANCLGCHQVQEGELLGAVSMAFDLTEQRRFGIITLLLTAAASLLFVGIMLYAIVRFFLPYENLFDQLTSGFRQVATGIFKEEPLHAPSKVKEEEILHDYNHMVRNLSGTLTEINSKAGILVGSEVERTGNVLNDTKATVDNLLDIYNFKRIIEKDLTKQSVYDRLEDVVGRIGVKKYSIYEIDNQKEHIKVIAASSDSDWARPDKGSDSDEAGAGIIWCVPDILQRPTECRAMRTGSIVDSSTFSNICPSFAFQDKNRAGEVGYRCLPLFVAGKVGNVVQIVYDEKDRQADQDAVPILQSYFQEAAPVLEAKTFMEMMRQQTLVDQLTGMYNRRFLDEMSSKIQSTAKRRRMMVGILMIDVDFFKMVNDEHGHNVGDTVLKTVSGVILDAVRSSDLAIRYGGEEMLVLLMDVAPGKPKEVAEKIRQSVESEAIEIPGGVLKKTVSVGVCEFPHQTDKFWQGIKYADLALYKAKQDGRNKVVQFSRDIWPQDEF